MDKLVIIQKLKEYKNKVAKQYGIKHLGLFGSYAIDLADEKSDIDVVVDLEKPDLFILVHIKDELEKLLGKHVDIVRNRERMNPYLKKQINKKVIYV